MRAFVRNNSGLILFLCIILYFTGCGSGIALFNETAYQQATSLKVDALAMMDKATAPFEQNKSEVHALLAEVEKAYEYAKGRPKNEISTRQWAILKAPNRNLLGGFFKRWEDKSTLSRTFIDEAKQGLIAEAFDLIISLESGKIKPKNAQLKGE